MCAVTVTKEDRFGPVTSAETRLRGQRGGVGGGAPPVRRLREVQTLPPPAELVEQLQYCE